jgi:hypothetical protein
MSSASSRAVLLNRDRSFFKEIPIERYWYVPPTLIVDGNSYYIRTSADGIVDPLEYTRITGIHQTTASPVPKRELVLLACSAVVPLLMGLLIGRLL